MLPIVHGLEREFGDRIIFVRVNILLDGNEALMEEYGFSTTPEFYLVGEGEQIIAAWDDGVTEEDFRRAFDEALEQVE